MEEIKEGIEGKSSWKVEWLKEMAALRLKVLNKSSSAAWGCVVTWLSGVGGELAAYLFLIQNFKEASNL